jgi:hypothetical protein
MAGNNDNLIPIQKGELSTEEAKQRGSKGGIASGEARRKKKVMTEIYAKWLEDTHELELDEGNKEELTGAQALNKAMGKIVERCDNVTVSVMKEIRETIEGQKVEVDQNITLDITEQKEKLKEKFAKIACNSDKESTD